jgi:hypothetical protein
MRSEVHTDMLQHIGQNLANQSFSIKRGDVRASSEEFRKFAPRKQFLGEDRDGFISHSQKKPTLQ